MRRAWIGGAIGVAALVWVLISSELVVAQFADSGRRSMGNLNPNPPRRSMGNLRPEAERSQTPQQPGSGSVTVVTPNPYYPGYYYDPGYYYAPYGVYPGYVPYGYPYGYARNYYYVPGYYYRYYALPPVVLPWQMFYGPQATLRFMGR